MRRDLIGPRPLKPSLCKAKVDDPQSNVFNNIQALKHQQLAMFHDHMAKRGQEAYPEHHKESAELHKIAVDSHLSNDKDASKLSKKAMKQTHYTVTRDHFDPHVASELSNHAFDQQTKVHPKKSAENFMVTAGAHHAVSWRYHHAKPTRASHVEHNSMMALIHRHNAENSSDVARKYYKMAGTK